VLANADRLAMKTGSTIPAVSIELQVSPKFTEVLQVALFGEEVSA
jgi:hypothetical protein